MQNPELPEQKPAQAEEFPVPLGKDTVNVIGSSLESRLQDMRREFSYDNSEYNRLALSKLPESTLALLSTEFTQLREQMKPDETRELRFDNDRLATILNALNSDLERGHTKEEKTAIKSAIKTVKNAYLPAIEAQAQNPYAVKARQAERLGNVLGGGNINDAVNKALSYFKRKR